MAFNFSELTRQVYGETWPNFKARPVPNLPAIKKAIAEIKLHFGRPVLKLGWLPDVMVTRRGERVHANIAYTFQVPFSEYYSDHRRLWIKHFKEVDVLIPRWGIYQLIPDDVGKPAWEEERWRWEGVNRVDMIGPYPTTGYYRELGEFGVIAHHEPNFECCRRKLASGDDIQCYGRYRKPDWALVDELRRRWNLFMQTRQLRMPTESPAPLEIYEGSKKIAAEQGAARERNRQQTMEEALEYIAPYLEKSNLTVDIGAAVLKGNQNNQVEGGTPA